MSRKHFKGTYPDGWKRIAEHIKWLNGYRCERCQDFDNKDNVLTVHHLDGDKSNCAYWNLAALCQRCHLHIQGKVFMPQFYMFPHSGWLIPHLRGYYAAYLAGFFDGEGSVGVTRTRPGRHGKAQNYRLWVSMINTNEGIIRLFQSLFGGSVLKRTSSHENGKPEYQWAPATKNAVIFLNIIKSHVLVKRQQVEIALQFVETIGW